MGFMKFCSWEDMKNSKRFVYLLTSGRLFELAYGGEERFTSLLGEWLVKQGVGVILMAATFSSIKSKMLSLEELQKYKELVVQKKKIRVLNPPYAIYLASRFLLSILWTLKIILLHYSYPIWLIHSQDTGYSGLAAIMAGKLLRIPVVLTSHGVRHKTLESSIHGRFRNLILKIEYSIDIFNIKNADMVIGVSPSIKDYFEKKSGRKIEYLPICINAREYSYSQQKREQIRTELGIGSDTTVIGFVGRFSEEKNLNTLLHSFANALLTRPDIRLVLVGTGIVEAELKNFVKSRGMEKNVIFCGVRYDIGKVLSSFDIFILPSITEGLSTSLLEAMACGRAIVCSDIDANRSIVTHEKNGLLVNPRNSAEIQHAIEILCQDQGLRSNLGMIAETTSLQYDEASVLPQILEKYKLLGGRSVKSSS